MADDLQTKLFVEINQPVQSQEYDMDRNNDKNDQPPSPTSNEGCPFCSIAQGNDSGRVIAKDEYSVAFLDRRPVFLGHSLLIPIRHYETLQDLPADLVNPIFSNVRLLSMAVQRAMDVDGIFIGINNKVSQSVPHLHVHVVPRKIKDGLRGFFWPRKKYASECEVAEIRDRIRREFDSLRA